MPNESNEHIKARSFSRTFEKICNFIAVAKTGDPNQTIRGLITMCLHEFPEDKFSESSDFLQLRSKKGTFYFIALIQNVPFLVSFWFPFWFPW